MKGGRCEACQGDGLVKIEMHFLPDVYVPCEVCKGKRYNRETLEVRFRGQSIADVLEMTVEDALAFFENQPRVRQKLETLNDVGLGYIHLGQSATTLSGGEAQRIKLATELSKRDTGRTLYILDEPTTGLHFEDVRVLLARAPSPRRSRQHGARHRAQPRRDQDGGLDHRPRPRRRHARRHDRRRRHAGGRRARRGVAHRPLPARHARDTDAPPKGGIAMVSLLDIIGPEQLTSLLPSTGSVSMCSLTGADNWPANTAGTTLPGGFSVFNNKLYILGGFNINVASTNQIWQFDPTGAVGAKWLQRVNTPVGIMYAPTATIGNIIYDGGDRITSVGG